MARSSGPRSKRSRGRIEVLPSGALRVEVYAGIDPVTQRRHRLREVIPAGPSARAAADKALRRLTNLVDERRNPRTNATLDQLLDQHFAMLDLEPNTIAAYRELTAGHIRPLIGAQKVGALDGAVLTRSMPSFAAADSGAVGSRSSSTAPRTSTTATSGAGSTSAARWRRPRSGRSTSFSAGRSSERCAGDGSR